MAKSPHAAALQRPQCWTKVDAGLRHFCEAFVMETGRCTFVLWFLKSRCAASFFLALLMLTPGCATWHSEVAIPETARGLPPPRRHPADVVFDISFVPIRPAKPLASLPAQSSDIETDVVQSPSDSAGPEEFDIWDFIDETVVGPESRYGLRRNGIRMGKPQSVDDFAQRLQQIRTVPTESSEILETADVQSDLSHGARRITFRVGKRYELPVRQISQDSQVVMVTTAEQTVGQTLSQAQPLFAMRVVSADARTVRLSLWPEIQHGAMRQTWVGNDAALRIENRRDAWVLSDLETEVSMEKGDVLVAGCREPAFGLGQHLFTGTTAEGDADQTLMIIRVVELPAAIITAAK